MHIVVIGVDHTTAPIELRERLSCPKRCVPQILENARQVAQECVFLSTCNRVELYAVCSDLQQGIAELMRVLCETRQLTNDELTAHSYIFVNQQAAEHLFGVACGLHSLVPGEPQIQGQVAKALEIAQGTGYAGPIMSALFRAALVTGKRARSETGISRNATSLSHVAVQLARHLLPDFRAASVLLVGSGKMSELAARNLRDNGAQHLVIINRTQANAVALAEALQATLRPFADLASSLLEADVVISSTTAPHAIITPELIQPVLQQRGDRSLLLIDIAMPRDIDPSVGALPGVHLYNLDDLQHEVERGISLRKQEASQVQTIVMEEVASFERWLASLSVAGTISELRQHVDTLRQQELARTLKQLSSSLSEREQAAIQELSTRLINKVLHIPTLRLKDAAAEGQGHIYAEAMRYLFGLEENKNDAADNNRDTGQQTGDGPDELDRSVFETAVAKS